MLRNLIKTSDDVVPMILRLILGIVFFAHGAQKMLGWFGGSGFSATLSTFENYLHIPAPFAVLAILAEFLGGLGLIFGLLGRVAALGILCNMLVAVYLVHGKNGLFMNWAGNQKGEGYEYHLLALAIAVAVIIAGSGALSIDRAWYRTLSGAAEPRSSARYRSA